MAFASSLFCSSKFLEHTHTLTKRLTVLACSDNTKDIRTPSIFGSFYPNVRFFFLCQNIGWRYGRGAKKTLVFFFFFFLSKCWCGNRKGAKKNLFFFFFFFAGRSFLRPPLSGALGDRLYRL